MKTTACYAIETNKQMENRLNLWPTQSDNRVGCAAEREVKEGERRGRKREREGMWEGEREVA